MKAKTVSATTADGRLPFLRDRVAHPPHRMFMPGNMEVKYDIGRKEGAKNSYVNVNAAYDFADSPWGLGVRVVEGKCLTGSVEFNEPSLFTMEVNAGFEKGECQCIYNAGVSSSPPITVCSGSKDLVFDLRPGSRTGALLGPEGLWFTHLVLCHGVPLFCAADCTAPRRLDRNGRAVHPDQVGVQKLISEYRRDVEDPGSR